MPLAPDQGPEKAAHATLLCTQALSEPRQTRLSLCFFLCFSVVLRPRACRASGS